MPAHDHWSLIMVSSPLGDASRWPRTMLHLSGKGTLASHIWRSKSRTATTSKIPVERGEDVTTKGVCKALNERSRKLRHPRLLLTIRGQVLLYELRVQIRQLVEDVLPLLLEQ